MRHKNKKIKLNRTTAHRKALIRNLIKNLLTHESIKTTLPKAKAVQGPAEKVIHLTKDDTLKNKRAVYSILGDHKLTKRVFSEIGPRFKDRAGGYTKIIALGARDGDGAQMALLSLVKLRAKTETTAKLKQKKKETKQKSREEKDLKQEKKKEKRLEEKAPEKAKEKKGFIGNLRKYLRRGKGQR
jgi:large subunit ribosomal protein L17